MALVPVNSVGHVIKTAGVEVKKGTATALAIGDVVAIDRSDNSVIRATSSHDNRGDGTAASADCLFGVCTSTEAAADTTCRVTPLVQGMLLLADLANNSSTDHNLQRMVLTDHDTLNNSGTDDHTDHAIFMQIAPVGAASDKKALVMILGVLGQAVA